MSDAYTRFLLTVIAFALISIALRLGSPIPPAYATETMECQFDGPLEIRRISEDVTVEVKQAYNQPGSSSSHPLYIKVVE